MLQLGTGRRASVLLPLALVALGTAVLATLNIADARAMAPSWGQDLAFFQQIVHSAAHGGPWASPLLLEPQGFWQMVHTHLVLPVVVAGYLLLPRQETLLGFQAFFAALALWPAFRLAEASALEQDARLPALAAMLAGLGLLLYGPFQAVGTCDFRPSVLFLPGILGVFAAAREGRPGQAIAWALVANLGRQEAPYLLAAAGLGLCLLPWGRALGRGMRAWLGTIRWRTGLLVLFFSVLAFGLWWLAKPQMFFHFDPTSLPPPADLAPEHLADRKTFLARVLRSGAIFGLVSPTGILSGLPLFAQMARDGREWTDLVGATAHYHAPWLAFVMASALVGAMRWPRRAGGAVVGALLFATLNGLAFPFPAPRDGPVPWRALAQAVPAEARVAADYDMIHAVAGRDVLWNTAQLLQPEEERPLAFQGDWPIPLDAVDVILVDADTDLARTALAAGWTVQQDAPLGPRTKLMLVSPTWIEDLAARTEARAPSRASREFLLRDSVQGNFHPTGPSTVQAEPTAGAYTLQLLGPDGSRLAPPLALPCQPQPVAVVALIPVELDEDPSQELAVLIHCGAGEGQPATLVSRVVQWRAGRLVSVPAWDRRLAGLSTVDQVRRALGLDE